MSDKVTIEPKNNTLEPYFEEGEVLSVKDEAGEVVAHMIVEQVEGPLPSKYHGTECSYRFKVVQEDQP
jgi:hypothetical protein